MLYRYLFTSQSSVSITNNKQILSLSGGGAIEMELSKYLRDYSRTIAGKEQLMIGAMAKALEVIPRQLCDNAGFDATNILNKLRQSHAQAMLQSSVQQSQKANRLMSVCVVG